MGNIAVATAVGTGFGRGEWHEVVGQFIEG
jgi:hypothetical protein